MASLFTLPNELILSSLSSQYPCRDQQIRSLATLLSVSLLLLYNLYNFITDRMYIYQSKSILRFRQLQAKILYFMDLKRLGRLL